MRQRYDRIKLVSFTISISLARFTITDVWSLLSRMIITLNIIIWNNIQVDQLTPDYSHDKCESHYARKKCIKILLILYRYHSVQLHILENIKSIVMLCFYSPLVPRLYFQPVSNSILTITLWTDRPDAGFGNVKSPHCQGACPMDARIFRMVALLCCKVHRWKLGFGFSLHEKPV